MHLYNLNNKLHCAYDKLIIKLQICLFLLSNSMITFGSYSSCNSVCACWEVNERKATATT